MKLIILCVWAEPASRFGQHYNCNENRVLPVKFSHREIPVMKTGVPAMRTGVPCNENSFSLCGKLHREIPVLALYWPCTGLQCSARVQTVQKGQKDRKYQKGQTVPNRQKSSRQPTI